MATADTQTPEPEPAKVEAFQERLLDHATKTLGLFAMHLGNQLGYYQALADSAGLTPGGLAEATGTHPRYAREWLEHQTVNGIVSVRDPSQPPEARVYGLTPERGHVLAASGSLDHLAPLIQTVVGAVHPIDEVEEAYRTGGGVRFGAFGKHMRQGQANLNKAMFLELMGTEWLPTLPDLDERLRRQPPAKVADIGCGAGWSCIGIAQAYPEARVDGYDLDEASVELARCNVKDAGVEARVRIHQQDASDPALDGSYDLVTAFECVHDMARPGDALAAMRRLAGDDGTVIVADERVGESFETSNEIEPLMYGWSVLHCLPAGRAEAPTHATGTVLRPDTLEALAQDAGFSSVDVLPIENVFFRFYHLEP